MTTTLYRNARVYAPGAPATAFVVSGERLSWLGADPDVGAGPTDETVDLGGAFVTPAFVDAHVHCTQTGLMLTGLDLHGATSLSEALDRVEAYARVQRGRPIVGTGWDETMWPERRPPTAAELDRASYGSIVYVSRTDVHSAVASSALLALCDLDGAAGIGPDGLVSLDAHHVVRRRAMSSLRPAQIRAAQEAALAEAARLGIGCVHEMSGPEVAGEDDLVSLLGLDTGVEVVAYWGALLDVETPHRLGLHGAGGDLFCDGSIGSRTAAFHAPYADAPGTSGALHHDVDEIAEHIALCVAAGLQCGFHVIGDRAVDTVLNAFETVAQRVGTAAVLAGRHRLEHAEAVSPENVERIAALGLVASVQPAFDAEWGGPDGMYATRLGVERAAMLNPFAAFASHGVALAFGSDAPVTPLDPWGGVRAAAYHHTGGFGLSPRAAFLAATRGGYRAAGDDDSGVLAVGAPATFAVWDATPLPPRSTDERIQGWSTDAGWAEAGLPEVNTAPDCLRTVVKGRTVWTAS